MALDGVRRDDTLDNRLSTILLLSHRRPSPGRGDDSTVLMSESADTRDVLDHDAGVAAVSGSSSVKRLPTEVAITESVWRTRRMIRTAGVAG